MRIRTLALAVLCSVAGFAQALGVHGGYMVATTTVSPVKAYFVSGQFHISPIVVGAISKTVVLGDGYQAAQVQPLNFADWWLQYYSCNWNVSADIQRQQADGTWTTIGTAYFQAGTGCLGYFGPLQAGTYRAVITAASSPNPATMGAWQVKFS